MRMFKWSAFFVVAVGSFIPDIGSQLISHKAIKDAAAEISRETEAVVGLLGVLPWKGLIFGLSFSLACVFAMRKLTNRPGLNEIMIMTLLSPFAQVLAPLFVMFAGRYLAHLHIPANFVSLFLYSILLAVLARSALFIEIGLIGIFLTGFVGAGVVALNLILPKGLPIYPSQYWYLFVGGFMGIFVGRQAH